MAYYVFLFFIVPNLPYFYYTNFLYTEKARQPPCSFYLPHIDYREMLDPTIRRTDRLQSSSDDWNGNLFDFYFRVYGKPVKDVKVPFKLEGGISDPRNKAIMKMLNLIGIGERAGSGVPDIYGVWEQQGWKEPEVLEQYGPDRTILKLSFAEKVAIYWMSK